MKKIPDNQIAFYHSPDDTVHIEVLYAEENIWLSQRKMAELFDIERSVVTKHNQKILQSGESRFRQLAEKRGKEIVKGVL